MRKPFLIVFDVCDDFEIENARGDGAPRARHRSQTLTDARVR